MTMTYSSSEVAPVALRARGLLLPTEQKSASQISSNHLLKEPSGVWEVHLLFIQEPASTSVVFQKNSSIIFLRWATSGLT